LKVSLLICGLLSFGLAIAQTEIPITVTAGADPHNPGSTMVVVKNGSNAALTAVALSGTGRPFPPGFDSVARIGAAGGEVERGGQYRIGLLGVTAAGQIQLGAAILNDGKTFGDPAQIQAILARREATLQALGIVIQRFPASASGSLMDVLRASQASEMNGVKDNAVRTAIANVNLTVQRSAQAMTGENYAAILAKLLDMLFQWRNEVTGSLPGL